MTTKNCFDEVRLLLALLVVIAHASVAASIQQLHWFTQYFDSYFAVKGFFAVSGFLVTKSFFTSKTKKEYFEKRFRRIYPAYILAIVYCFILGLFLTTYSASDFIFNLHTIRYIISNVIFLNFIQPTLPGVFIHNNMHIMDASLWTIKVELTLYFTVPILCYGYKSLGKKNTFLIAFTLGALWFVYFYNYFGHGMGPRIAKQFPGQLPYFAFGSVLGFINFTKKQSIYIIIGSILYYFLIRTRFPATVQEIINMIVYPLFVICLATTTFLSVGVGKFGDMSYGIYLFHFPTVQLLEHLGLFKLNPYLGLATALLLTIALAYFSWHLVEKKFLKRSSHYIRSSQKPVVVADTSQQTGE